MDADEPFDQPLYRALRYPARVAILAVFVERRGEALGATTVARDAGLAVSTFHDHRDTLVDLEFVERHDEEGYPSYTLAETKQARLLCELDSVLSDVYGRREDVAVSVEEFVE
ncbi:helix-turn-helix domain-containing protein [Haloarchaeobius sp. TZWWS8]|uniref:helix-turn-helix domain-containing protein n=1 Tax=Haloarchaeobius sp. TZWWS8 TaxID=3446121 RepID=UPI003EBAC227